jgi:hypothetical protein
MFNLHSDQIMLLPLLDKFSKGKCFFFDSVG